ncbi:MAG: LysR family transcriptional regulator [Clostridiales bacterium]|nr:LysR family transcriptional regulator [Clostridiales bacterium]
MNLLQLQYFCQVAKDENFSRSSQILFVSQPALSQMISRLESELGVDLFDRIGKRIQLNRNGELFFEYASRALKELEIGMTELSKLQGRDHSTISVSTMCDVRSISEIMLEFQQKYPGTHLEYRMSNASESIRALLNYEIDVAITNRFTEDSRLEDTMVYSQTVFACLGKNHPLERESVISIHNLKDDTFICNDVTTDRYETEAICRRFNIIPDIAIETNDATFAASLLGAHPYVMLLKPTSLAHRLRMPDEPADHIVRLKEKIESPLIVTRRKKHHFSPAQEEFFHFIIDLLREDNERYHLLYQKTFAISDP